MRTLLSGVLIVLLFPPELPAHHSHGNYDTRNYVHLEGTVSEVHWINPHTWVYLEVTGADGERAIWALEGASISQLEAAGWQRGDLEPGDRIKARCHQMRDGSNGCLLGYITPEGGEEKVFD